ncbi:MAG TPA: hypothetical protein VGL86_26440 [Polyangia bacterium]
MPGKGDLKAAAAHLQRGFQRYGEGDVAGGLIEFEKALELYGPMRGRPFADWVKWVQGSVAKAGAPLDDDALRAVSDALEVPRDATVPTTPAVPAVPTAPGIMPGDRMRKPTPVPPGERMRKLTPTPMETAATMTLPQPPAATPKVTRDAESAGESPWDPVPLTPRGTDVPPELAEMRRRDDALAELQSQQTKAVAGPASLKALASGKPEPGSSSTILGMPALEPKLLTPQNRKRNRVAEDRPESVTREFRSATPTGPNLRPLDVPELTDEQIQSLLALDSPLIPEGRTTPQIELDRIDEIDRSHDEHLIEMEAQPTPLPHRGPPGVRVLKNDTNPMGVEAMTGEFEPSQLTPTGIKPTGLKPVREPQPEDDPYADLNLLPLEVAPDLSGPDEVEEGGTNPTNPFIRGAHASKLAQFSSSASSSQDVKLEDMPPLPTLPGARQPAHGHPLGAAEAALQAGDLAAAVDACEMALEASGGLGGKVARDHLPLVEQIYGAILGGAERTPVHGKAVADLEPRSAFLLSRLDGSMTVEDVLDVSGMPRLEALRTMALLVRRGAVIIK